MLTLVMEKKEGIRGVAEFFMNFTFLSVLYFLPVRCAIVVDRRRRPKERRDKSDK